MKSYAFGVDLGGTTVKIGLFRTDGELVYRHEIPTRKEKDGAYILGDIAKAVKKDLADRKISPDELEGIGIDIPGPVIHDSIVNRAVNLGWGVVDVAEELKQLTGVEKICVGNDANVAALGEMWKGGGKGHKNVVMVTLGTGVGGGIILNGKILPGVFGAAGEIGHIQVNPDETLICGCGKNGHLEQYASATGIARVAKEMLAQSEEPSSLRGIASPSARDVFDAAKAGDFVALEIVNHVCRILGRALAMISCVVDPEIFVIGGGVSKAGSILTDTVRKYYVEAAFHASEGTKIALAELGNDAGMYGAVKMVLG